MLRFLRVVKEWKKAGSTKKGRPLINLPKKNLHVELPLGTQLPSFSNLIIVQQDTAVFSLLYFCRQLYMFRVLTTNIRSSYNCNSASGTGQPGLLPSDLQLNKREQVVVDPVDQCQKL